MMDNEKKDNNLDTINNIPETDKPPVPFIVMESVLNRIDKERIAHYIIIIILILGLIGSNMYWLYVWNQYEYEATETVTVDGKEGVANYIGDGNKGTVTYGEDNSDQGKNLEEKVGDKQGSKTEKEEVTP